MRSTATTSQNDNDIKQSSGSNPPQPTHGLDFKSDDESDISFPMDYKDLQLSTQTLALFEAIKESNVKNVLVHIKAGADVNALVEEDSAKKFNGNGNSVLALTTPLALAVLQLNYDIIKALLENGANPNILGIPPRSLIEVLMMAIGNLETAHLLGTPAKKPLKLFGISLPVNVDSTVTPDVIKIAEYILDLLLCYGLNPNVDWTEIFTDGNKNLAEAVTYHHSTEAKRSAMPDTIIAALDASGEVSSIKKSLLSGVIRGALWVAKQRAPKSSVHLLPDYLATVPQVREKAAEAVLEISDEKGNLLVKYRHCMSAALHKVPSWPREMSDVVIQYTTNFSREVAEQRLATHRTLRFWQKAPDHKVQAELDRKKIIQSYQYTLHTQDLKNIIQEKAHNLVIEYLVDPTTEPGKPPTKAANKK